MRIRYYFPGTLAAGQGSRTHVCEIVTRLRRYGAQVDVTPVDPTTTRRDAPRWRRMAAALRAQLVPPRKQADVVYTRMHPLAFGAPRMARRLGVSLVLEVNHGLETFDRAFPAKVRGRRVWRRSLLYQIRSADVLITVSNELRDWLAEVAPGTPTHVIPCGVDLDTFAPSTNPPEKQILFFGLFSNWQHIPELLAATQSPTWPPGVKLAFAGQGPLAALIKEHDGPRVSYLGVLPHAAVPDLIRKSTATVSVKHPSQAEATPLKLLESWGCGVPAIANDIGTQGRMLKAARGAITVEAEPDAIASAAAQLATDSALRAQLGAAGRTYVEAHSWDARAKDTWGAIDACTASPHRLAVVKASRHPTPDSLGQWMLAGVVGGSDPKALITGITGQDGSYLAELLLAKGYEVHGIIRRASNFNTARIDHLYQGPQTKDAKLRLHYGDLTDASSLRRTLEAVQPDEVYNLGAQSHVKVSFENPLFTAESVAVGTLRLLEAFRDHQENTDRTVRFYQAGSSEMYGATPPPQTETTPFAPRSPYAVSKVAAHWYARNYRESYDLHISNGILFNHESPRRGETFVTRKITRAVGRIKHGMQDTVYLGNLDASRDWGFAGDYVDAMWRMLQQNQPDDYVIATGQSHSVRTFLERAFAHAGLEWQEHVQVDSRYFRPSEVDALQGDASKAERELDWTPTTSFDELVGMMVDADLELAARERTLVDAGHVVAHGGNGE